MSECSCCQNKAKYDVDGDRCCGKHLTVVVDLHCDFPPHTTKVEKIEEQPNDDR
jgi:hypothetical protein